MFSTYHLTHEQRRAFSYFEKNLYYCTKENMVSLFSLTSDDITNEGNSFFIEGHISPAYIPRENGLKWNQSRTKSSLNDELNEFNISFFKLNTRKTSNNKKEQPKYKLWIFNITHLLFGFKTSFIWCEKGRLIPLLDDNLLKELCFLENFVPKDQAIEFGWYKSFHSSPFDFSDTTIQYSPTSVMVDCSNFSLF